jgi:predicted amidohydrolase YtcJ
MHLLINAEIHTLNPSRPIVSAVAIEQGRFVALGSDSELLLAFGSRAVYEDMEGRTLWPGLTDAHFHLEMYALGLQRIDCETTTRDECVRRVAVRAQTTPPGQWILGHGWNHNVWLEGFGTIADLDAAAPNHPVFLTAKSVHSAWVNSAALRMAGITSSTPDPEGGKLIRDSRGNPTGILLENAIGLVERIIPAPGVAEVSRAIQEALPRLWKMGLTGLHDCDGSRCFSALQILDQQSKLQFRVVKNIPLEHVERAVKLGLRSGFGSDHLRIGSIKLFADGALGPQTAAMLQPYEGDPTNTGMLLLDSEQVLEFGQQAATSGLSLAIHAIGDRANHEILNAYAQLRAFEHQAQLPALRHRIEHVQVLHPHDFFRLAELNVIASVQPIHATSDMLIADRFLGTRSAGAYPFRTLLESGAHLAFGSDAPVESPNPFWGIHAAVTRRRADGTPGVDGWYSEQRLPIDAALRGYTTGPAYAAGWENQLGRISPGFFADLIVLPESPFNLPPQELHRVSPLATMVGGEWVWKAEKEL